MNFKLLNRINRYQQNPDKLLSCCKKFAIERVYNFRWKNRIYFRDNRIKIINFKNDEYCTNYCKKIWFKYGKIHYDHIDQNTGLTLPAKIWKNGLKEWYKDGKFHRDDIDQETGLTLPFDIWNNGDKCWYKKGKLHRDNIDPDTGFKLPAYDCHFFKEWTINDIYHRDDIDPETGFTLPAIIFDEGEYYYNNGDKNRDDIDPKTGFTLPAVVFHNETKIWYRKNKCHNDDIDPVSGFTLPAAILINGIKDWEKHMYTPTNDESLEYELYCDEFVSFEIPFPNFIGEYTTYAWYKDGKLHREDKDPENNLTLPALKEEDTSSSWYKNGKLHRDDKEPITEECLPASDSYHWRVFYKDGEEFYPPY
jgi:hypothetical protein